jgi:hypothetical protein
MLKKTLSLHCESFYNLNLEKMRKAILLIFSTLLFFACNNQDCKNKTSTKSTDTVFVKDFSDALLKTIQHAIDFSDAKYYPSLSRNKKYNYLCTSQ